MSNAVARYMAEFPTTTTTLYAAPEPGEGWYPAPDLKPLAAPLPGPAPGATTPGNEKLLMAAVRSYVLACGGNPDGPITEAKMRALLELGAAVYAIGSGKP